MMRFYPIANLDGGGWKESTERKKNNNNDKPYKRVDYHVAFFEKENPCVISYLISNPLILKL